MVVVVVVANHPKKRARSRAAAQGLQTPAVRPRLSVAAWQRRRRAAKLLLATSSNASFTISPIPPCALLRKRISSKLKPEPKPRPKLVTLVQFAVMRGEPPVARARTAQPEFLTPT